MLLLAFGLRVAGLERQSIWVDEGFSVDFSSLSAGDMTAMWKARGGFGVISNDPRAQRAANDPLAIAVDIHPPLYYLMLHEWMLLAGRGEYSVRFPSVIAGTLLVLLLYKMGASLGSREVGAAAAGVGSIAPFYIAYSQEARMYAPVALFGGLSLYFTWLVLRRGRWRLAPWLGLVVCSSLALYTHYSAVLVIGAENLLVAGVIGWRIARRQPFLRWPGIWTGAQLLQLALFFPWLRTSIGQVAKYNQNLWVPNWQHELTETFRAFDAGLWLPTGESLRLGVPVSIILLGGIAVALVGWGRRWSRLGPTALPAMAGGSDGAGHPRRAARAAVLPSSASDARFDSSGRRGPAVPAADVRASAEPGWAHFSGLRGWPQMRMPLLFGGGVLLLELALALIAFQIRPEFSPRYLIVLATPYYLLLGLALATLQRRWWPLGVLAGVGLAAIFAVGLQGYEFDPSFAKDDTRSLAQYLTSHTTAHDVIFLDAPEPLGYYYHGPATLVSIPGDEATVAQAMTRNAAGKTRVVFVQWFVSTSDPEQLVPFLLQKYGRLVDDKGFRGYRARTYAIPSGAQFRLSPTDRPESANFNNILRLKAAGLGPSAAGEAQLLPQLSQPIAFSGNQLLLALDWQLLKPVAKDYKVTAYLTDDRGHIGGQQDLLLRHDQATTSRWPAGTEATNYYVLHTLPGLMPGHYTVNLGVYREGEQERLSVLDSAGAPRGGNVAIAGIDVLPPTMPANVALAKPLDVSAAPGISLVGGDIAQPIVAQGDPLHVTLFWRATGQPGDGLKTTLALEQDGQVSPAWQFSASPGFPTGQWRAGDVFRDWQDPVVPPQLTPGTYRVLAGMGGHLAPIGQVQVQGRKRTFAAPSPEHPLTASLGGSIELLGYDQDKPAYAPGSTAKITLYWRGTAAMAASYTAFVHVLDSGRHVVAQVDAIPAHGQAPTNSWLPGEVTRDVYELALKPALDAGAYQLEAGFYRGDTGVRLKATSPDVSVVDDGLLLGPLTVTK
ncbi:MAG TPA: glycosyltransferase family 39 protein [Chloroflexota bacterium]|nr:glycosyltransferase family 39 protein [Chloroflexota bacterium]